MSRTPCHASRLLDGTHQVDDSPNPLQFSQVFHLIPDAGSYYVYVPILCSRSSSYATRSRVFRFNDIFRLNYGA